MGNKRKYTRKKLDAEITAYFDSISAQELLFELEPMFAEDEEGNVVPVVDGWGHQKYRRVPVIAANGKQAVRTKWIIQPKITDLCAFLGITTSTWANYCKHEEFFEPTTRAQGRVESYWQEQLNTKDGSRGAKFVLEYNCGWRGKKEKSAEEETPEARKFAEHMTMEEKLAFIRAAEKDMAQLIPKEEEKNEGE